MSKSSAHIWFRRIVEVAWLFVLAVSIVEVIINLRDGEYLKALIFVGFGAVAAFMFTMRRKQRRNIEKRS